MLIAIVGTRSSGKSTIEEFFVSNYSFTSVQIAGDEVHTDPGSETSGSESGIAVGAISQIQSQATTSSDDFTAPSTNLLPLPTLNETTSSKIFGSAKALLLHVTKNWQQNFVTVDICTRHLVELFVRRPFFMLLCIDAPIYTRFMRSRSASLVEFVQDHDRLVFGSNDPSRSLNSPHSSLKNLSDLIDVHVNNVSPTISALHAHLQDLNLLDPEFLRPRWDTYFMTMAYLASRRSNCMKRRVGAVLARENRVVATGYNGTPRGLQNCNECGCQSCNGTSQPHDASSECLCLHAEENALLEAGRERVGANAVLYCNTCPCLRCTVKIIQTGVKTVVYNLTYKVDDASARLFEQAGVELRRWNPSKLPRYYTKDPGLH